MDKSTALVLNGLMSLTESQRALFIVEANKFLRSNTINESLKKSMLDSVSSNESYSLNFGPTPHGCVCCGR